MPGAGTAGWRLAFGQRNRLHPGAGAARTIVLFDQHGDYVEHPMHIDTRRHWLPSMKRFHEQLPSLHCSLGRGRHGHAGIASRHTGEGLFTVRPASEACETIGGADRRRRIAFSYGGRSHHSLHDLSAVIARFPSCHNQARLSCSGVSKHR